MTSRAPERTYSRDDAEQSTLQAVHKDLSAAMEEIDKWHAFDTEEKELTLKQQIVAHRKAYEMVAPALDAVTNALATIDSKYRQG